MRYLFIGVFSMLVIVSAFIITSLWEMFDNEEGIDD